MNSDQLRRSGWLSNLGPDLLAVDFDEKQAFDRLHDYPDIEIGVALLRQSIVAGIGNIYKSETLFSRIRTSFDDGRGTGSGRMPKVATSCTKSHVQESIWSAATHAISW